MKLQRRRRQKSRWTLDGQWDQSFVIVPFKIKTSALGLCVSANTDILNSTQLLYWWDAGADDDQAGGANDSENINIATVITHLNINQQLWLQEPFSQLISPLLSKIFISSNAISFKFAHMTIFILACEKICKQNCKFLTAKFPELQVALSVVKFGN